VENGGNDGAQRRLTEYYREISVSPCRSDAGRQSVVVLTSASKIEVIGSSGDDRETEEE
jgi:hypothetical protein